jgi:hypothetical protein
MKYPERQFLRCFLTLASHIFIYLQMYFLNEDYLKVLISPIGLCQSVFRNGTQMSVNLPHISKLKRLLMDILY